MTRPKQRPRTAMTAAASSATVIAARLTNVFLSIVFMGKVVRSTNISKKSVQMEVFCTPEPSILPRGVYKHPTCTPEPTILPRGVYKHPTCTPEPTILPRSYQCYVLSVQEKASRKRFSCTGGRINPAIPPFCNYLYEKTSIGGMRPVQIVRQDKDCHGVPGRLRTGTASFGKMPKDVTERPASFGKTPKDAAPRGGLSARSGSFCA